MSASAIHMQSPLPLGEQANCSQIRNTVTRHEEEARLDRLPIDELDGDSTPYVYAHINILYA